jgi:hypothetical protein
VYQFSALQNPDTVTTNAPYPESCNSHISSPPHHTEVWRASFKIINCIHSPLRMLCCVRLIIVLNGIVGMAFLIAALPQPVSVRVWLCQRKRNSHVVRSFFRTRTIPVHDLKFRRYRWNLSTVLLRTPPLAATSGVTMTRVTF